MFGKNDAITGTSVLTLELRAVPINKFPKYKPSVFDAPLTNTSPKLTNRVADCLLDISVTEP